MKEQSKIHGGFGTKYFVMNTKDKNHKVKKRVLVQWIGHTDMRWLASKLPKNKSKEIVEKLGIDFKEENNGPTATLLEKEAFDEVLLLSTYDKKWNDWFVGQLSGVKPKLKKVALKHPFDFEKVYEIASDELGALRSQKSWKETELCLHLTPGTSTMTAVWLLLGKTSYPATFFQSTNHNAFQVKIPFDITLDVIPALFNNPDRTLQHLASQSPSEVAGFEDIIGDSNAIRLAVGRAKRSAMRSVSVLLLGESGTGKEMFANAIMSASPRRDKKFIAINCATLSRELLQSELFGHKAGAFTDAKTKKDGAFKLADGGTIFLDEIGECDLDTQAQLLRALQPITKKGTSVRKIQPLGESKEIEVDVRIIAATNQDLRQLIKERKFREDLFYRLATITITLPPLRERKGDIERISEVLLAQINRQFEVDEPAYEHKNLSASAKSFVKRHDWPGNVRQLYNALVQAAVLCDGDIKRSDIKAAIGEMPVANRGIQSLASHPLGDGFELDKHMESIHLEYLKRAVEEADWTLAEASRLLGIKDYQKLSYRLKKFGIEKPKNS